MQSCRVTNGIQHGTETEWSKIKIAIEILRGAIVAQPAAISGIQAYKWTHTDERTD